MANYTIQWGDTLSGIARANNTDVNTLMSLNPYITNANKIYAGKNLVLPDPQPVATPQPVEQQAQPVVQQQQPATPTKSTQEWAQEYAKNRTANVGNEGQALLDQYEKIAEQQKQALASQKELTANQINSQKDDVLQTYNSNARQAYINSMLGKKTVEQELSQAGLNTSGLLGSAYANVENAYGNNLANLQTSRDKSINDINKQLNEAQLQYAIKESELLANIENAKLELQKYNNQLAYQKYQDAIDEYMKFANFDYTKQIDERNYNYQKSIDDRDYEYQKQRDAIADSQWQKEYELALKKANSSSSSSRSSSSRSSSGSSSGNYSLEDNTPVEMIRDNVIGIKTPKGYATLTITSNATRDQILRWGNNYGVDLNQYDIDSILNKVKK